MFYKSLYKEWEMVNYSPRSTVLVVDDQPANIRVLGEALKSDYQIKMARSGIKAIEIASSDDPPDLILLDIIICPPINKCRIVKVSCV